MRITFLAALLLSAAAQAQTTPAPSGAANRQEVRDALAAKADSARLDAEIARATTAEGAMVLRQMAASPAIPTCPVSNCPAIGRPGFGGAYGGPTLSAAWTYGQSTPDPHPQFFANDGFFVKDGAGSAGRGQYVTRYVGAMQGPGAGPTWAVNSDIVRGACPGGPNSLYGQPGSGVPFGDAGCTAAPGSLGRSSTVGYELDLSNFDADSGAHGAFVVGLYVNTLSRFTSGAGISFGNAAASGQPPSWHHGIEFAPRTVADSAIYDVAGAPFGYYAGGAHGLATIHDESTGPLAIDLTGTKTVADIKSTSGSPAIMSLQGAHAVAALHDASTGPAALKVDGAHTVASLSLNGDAPTAVAAAGTYALAAYTSVEATAPISLQAAPGQRVCLNGTTNCVSYSAALGKFLFTNDRNVVKASLDNNGNMVLSGTLTQNGTP